MPPVLPAPRKFARTLAGRGFALAIARLSDRVDLDPIESVSLHDKITKPLDKKITCHPPASVLADCKKSSTWTGVPIPLEALPEY